MSLSEEERLITLEVDFTTSLITAATAALITYDYLLTVRREARLFWKRKVNVSSILFFSNRYIAVVYYVGLYYYRTAFLPYPVAVTSLRYKLMLLAVVGYRTPLTLRQNTWNIFPGRIVFSALRVHALSQKNWFLTSFTFFWAILALPVDYYGDFYHRTFIIDPVIGCTSSASTPTFLSEIGTIFIWGGQAIADAVVIGVTWKAAYQARSEGSMSSLLGVMFKNGTLYFIVLFVLNILHIVFIFLPNSVLHVPLPNSSYVVWISEPLTAILISHFMLDLHEAHRALPGSHSSDLPTIQVMSLDVGEPYSRGPEREELDDLLVASNPSSSHAGPGRGVGSAGRVDGQGVPCLSITRSHGDMESV